MEFSHKAEGGKTSSFNFRVRFIATLRSRHYSYMQICILSSSGGFFLICQDNKLLKMDKATDTHFIQSVWAPTLFDTHTRANTQRGERGLGIPSHST